MLTRTVSPTFTTICALLRHPFLMALAQDFHDEQHHSEMHQAPDSSPTYSAIPSTHTSVLSPATTTPTVVSTNTDSVSTSACYNTPRALDPVPGSLPPPLLFTINSNSGGIAPYVSGMYRSCTLPTFSNIGSCVSLKAVRKRLLTLPPPFAPGAAGAVSCAPSMYPLHLSICDKTRPTVSASCFGRRLRSRQRVSHDVHKKKKQSVK